MERNDERLDAFKTAVTHRCGGESSAYFDALQRETLHSFRRSWTWRTEWPTWLVLGAIYMSWFSIAIHARSLGLPVAVLLLAIVSAWYMSLQHELIHGHPTPLAWINALLGFAPLAVWFPYEIYRRSHLAHHATSELTHPHLDPESLFVSATKWQQANRFVRMLIVARTTFVGHVLIGPAFSLAATAQGSWRRISKGDFAEVSVWIVHLLALAKLVAWLKLSCGIPVSLFTGGVGYPALCISSIRSFREHRYHPDPACRTVVNRAALPWRLLFLNNNFHAVHHHLPGVPWYALGVVYRGRADDYRRRSGEYVVDGYQQWLRQFALKPRSPLIHPSA
ncbi:fatty acid desaturase [Trinickia sp. Y13]|uniref:fatty acid desaturase n=1 Tax=Trinickia sp. Y13 TaxID=2917807 RepID=UPI002405D4C9|nr:fatty acid desaturase [Trinickia sp. Y13]MDG0025859.1 fatty acid desaturase [Trinickia sp. Y13]